MKLISVRKAFRLEVDVALADTERIAVVGPNAAGKSTLLDAWLRSKKVRRGRTPAVLLEQQSLLFPHLSVAENIAFSLRAQGCTKKEAYPQAVEQLTAAGLADVANSLPKMISGGQQQRAALLRALATRSETVLLDEPLAGLDVRAAREYREILKQRMPEIKHLVIVTHDPTDILQIVNRVLVIQDGRLVKDCSVDELFRTPPDQFTAALVDCNRIELGAQIVWFAPQSARLSVLPETITSSALVTRDGLRLDGRIASIERFPHRDRLQVSLEKFPQPEDSAGGEISVELGRDESMEFQVGDFCLVTVPPQAVITSGV